MKSWLHILALRIRSLFRNSQTNTELDKEIAFHLDMLTEQNVAAGMTPKAARAAARREFGHVDGVREACKASWGVRMLEEFAMDLRNAFRQAMNHQGHTFAIVLTLGVCLGSNITALNFVRKIVAEPYAYQNVDQVVKVGMRHPKIGRTEVSELSIPKYVHLKEQTASFLELGFIDDNKEFDLERSGQIQRISVDKITSEVWDITGIRPLAGQFFSEEEAEKSNGQVAVLSESLALQLGPDAQSVVGTSIQLDSKPYKVIGVAPNSFHLNFAKADLWLPRIFESEELLASERHDHSYTGIAKLASGVSIEQANQQLANAYETYLDKYPQDRDDKERYGSTFGSVNISDSLSENVPQIGFAFRSIQAVTLIVLAIGCLNVSGMFLLKSYSRINDFAMRKALGATTLRIVRQMTIEVCLYFMLGGFASIIFLRLGFWAAEALYITEIPWVDGLRIDFYSLLMTAAVAFVAALLTAILPIFSILRRDLHEFIKSNGRTATASVSSHRLRSFFVITQVSLSVILLVAAGVLASNLYKTLQKNIGFEKESRIAFEVPQPTYRFGNSHEDYVSEVLPYQQRVLEKIRSVPGVQSAAAANRIPMSPYHTGHSTISMSHYQYQPDEPHARALRVATLPGYFETMDTKIVSGRDFAETDSFDSERVVIVSQNLVEKYFQDQEPIGSTINFWGESLRIVGVAEDVQDKPYFIPWNGYTLYFPYSQWSSLSSKYTIYFAEVQGDIEQRRQEIERALKQLDPHLTVVSTPLTESFEMATFAHRIPMVFSIFFGVLALLLSSIGIYGLISFIVAERTKELGIRMAFGASPERVLNRVLGSSGKLIAIGLVAGLAIAVPLSIKVNPLLADVNATNPAIFSLVVLFVVGISLGASFIPARRATRIDIAQTLRV